MGKTSTPRWSCTRWPSSGPPAPGCKSRPSRSGICGGVFGREETEENLTHFVMSRAPGRRPGPTGGGGGGGGALVVPREAPCPERHRRQDRRHEIPNREGLLSQPGTDGPGLEDDDGQGARELRGTIVPSSVFFR